MAKTNKRFDKPHGDFRDLSIEYWDTAVDEHFAMELTAKQRDYLERLTLYPELKRDRERRVSVCDCAQVNKLAFGSLPKRDGGSPTKDFAFARVEVKPRKNGTCPHCGYYTTLVKVSSLNAGGKGLRSAGAHGR